MIEICEVGPCEENLTPETKIEFIQRLVDSGMKTIEVIAFSQQNADSEEMLKALPKSDGISFAGLVCNRSELERALNTSIDTIRIAIALDGEIKDAVKAGVCLVKESVAANRDAVAVLEMAFGTPSQGAIPVKRVVDASETLMEAGASGITLADTTGVANPLQVAKVVHMFRARFGDDVRLGLHFHNTRGLALANVFASYQAGARIFDSSLAGIGANTGGNVCTEDMVHMFEQMNVRTNTNLTALIDTARWLERKLGRTLAGMMMKL